MMMKLLKKIATAGFIWFLLFAHLSVEKTQAVGSGDWVPDVQVPGYLNDTFTPFLVADQNKTVHAFASQWVDDGDRRRAVVYRQWTLVGGWTRPLDILLSPVGGSANFLGAYLDSSDTMHVIFMATEALTRETFIYYSSAPAVNADWGPAWSEPIVVGWNAMGLVTGAIIGDDEGDLVVIYSGNRDGSGVYSVYSKNSGKDWSKPVPVFLTYDTELSTFSLRLALGPEQRISAVWNVVTNFGVDQALYFAGFDSENYKWDTPVELDRKIDLPGYFGPSYPSIVDNGKEIVVAYNSGNPFTDRPVGAGRPIKRVNISIDGGLTWSGPLDPFPFHNGRSGEDAMTLDGNGNPHVLFIQRIDTMDDNGKYTAIGGIWHSMFQDGTWSSLDRLVPTVSPHDIRAVVAQGNVLLAVWREDPGAGQSGIWYSYSILDVPELPVTPLATTFVDYSVPADATAIPPLVFPEPSPRPALLENAPPSNLGSNPALPIIIGIVPVTLILIGVFLGYRILISRRE